MRAVRRGRWPGDQPSEDCASRVVEDLRRRTRAVRTADAAGIPKRRLHFWPRARETRRETCCTPRPRRPIPTNEWVSPRAASTHKGLEKNLRVQKIAGNCAFHGLGAGGLPPGAPKGGRFLDGRSLRGNKRRNPARIAYNPWRTLTLARLPSRNLEVLGTQRRGTIMVLVRARTLKLRTAPCTSDRRPAMRRT
jgi:hypothetical protein